MLDWVTPPTIKSLPSKIPLHLGSVTINMIKRLWFWHRLGLLWMRVNFKLTWSWPQVDASLWWKPNHYPSNTQSPPRQGKGSSSKKLVSNYPSFSMGLCLLVQKPVASASSSCGFWWAGGMYWSVPSPRGDE